MNKKQILDNLDKYGTFLHLWDEAPENIEKTIAKDEELLAHYHENKAVDEVLLAAESPAFDGDYLAQAIMERISGASFSFKGVIKFYKAFIACAILGLSLGLFNFSESYADDYQDFENLMVHSVFLNEEILDE